MIAFTYERAQSPAQAAAAVAARPGARFIAGGLLQRAREHSPDLRRDDVTVVVVVDGADGQFVLPKYCCAVEGDRSGPWNGPPGWMTGGVFPVSTSNWAGVHPLAKRKVVVPASERVLDLTPASVCGHWIPRSGIA